MSDLLFLVLVVVVIGVLFGSVVRNSPAGVVWTVLVVLLIIFLLRLLFGAP